MTNEELAVAIQQGETDKLHELWDGVEKLVRWKAGRVLWASGTSIDVEFDELYDAGYIALTKAVPTYKPDHSMAFSTWYMFYLQTAFADVLGCRTAKQRSDPLRNAVSLEAPIQGKDGDDGCTLGDTIADDVDISAIVTGSVWRQQLHTTLAAALSTLDERQAQVIQLEFYNGKTLNQISEILGVTPSCVSQIRNKALSRLRDPKVIQTLQPFFDGRHNRRRKALSRAQLDSVTGNGQQPHSIAEGLAAYRMSLIQGPRT